MDKKETILPGKVLKLEVEMAQTAKLQLPFAIQVILKNVSKVPQLVNKRLSMGYKSSLARELFVSISKTKSGPIIGAETELYERDFSKPEDFVWLQPDQQVTTEFNLFDWYELPGKGSYYIKVCYQADEKLAYKPADLTKGTFCSAVTKVTFE